MLAGVISSIRVLPSTKQNVMKILTYHMQQKMLSAKTPLHKEDFSAQEANKPKPKTQPIPKITLIQADKSLSITTLEEAQKISKRRDLKLVKILDLDTKTQRPIYKLMTGSEYHAEDLKQREEHKKAKSNQYKGEKILMLTSNIAKHDLEVNVKKMTKWLDKKYEIRVVVNGESTKAENVYKFFEAELKEKAKIVQKRSKGADLKFQLLPTITEDSKGSNL